MITDEIQEIIVDCKGMFNYATYYLHGIEQLGVNYRFAYIDSISLYEMEDYRRGVGLIAKLKNGKEKRIYIDTADRNNIHQRFYEWADVYAKINLSNQDRGLEKVFAIGPSFGIQLWNPVKTIYRCFANYFKCKRDVFQIPLKIFIRDYLYSFVRRKGFNTYNTKCTEDSDYIFSLSTLWYDEQTYNTTNRLRGVFAKLAKRIYPKFEGGFFYISSAKEDFSKYAEYQEEYKDMLIYKRIPMKDYMESIKKSAIVFNTPSVVGCHGWKMGEYLAMGKAMISTPLNNIMPGNFKSGIHYIEAKNEEEIEQAILFCRKHPEHIQQFKKNATEYFEKYLAPSIVITRILSRI